MEQRKVLGCQIALVDLQLMNDAPQFAVARFDARDGSRKICRWRGVGRGSFDVGEQRTARGVEWVPAAARLFSDRGGSDATALSSIEAT